MMPMGVKTLWACAWFQAEMLPPDRVFIPMNDFGDQMYEALW